MRRTMWINGWDVIRAGLIVENVEGWLDGPSVLERVTQLPTRLGAIPLPREAETSPRNVTVNGLLKGTSLTDCRNKIHELRGRLFGGAIEVSFADHPDRIILARCSEHQVVITAPQFALPASRVTIRLLCPDPLAYELLGDAVGFNSLRAACPLGTAVSYPVIRIAGAVTNPVLSYRDFRGDVRQTMGFTVTLGATEYLEIDTEMATVTRYTAGVAADGIALWTSGDFLTGLDPQDAEPIVGAWPTLEVSPTAEAEAFYRKAYL